MQFSWKMKSGQNAAKMRVNTSMLLKNKKSNELAIAVIDSADINSGILYQIKMRKCHK